MQGVCVLARMVTTTPGKGNLGALAARNATQSRDAVLGGCAETGVAAEARLLRPASTAWARESEAQADLYGKWGSAGTGSRLLPPMGFPQARLVALEGGEAHSGRAVRWKVLGPTWGPHIPQLAGRASAGQFLRHPW